MHEMWRMNISCAISNSKDCFKLKRKLLVENEKILAEHCKMRGGTHQYLLLDADRGELNIWSLETGFSRVGHA